MKASARIRSLILAAGMILFVVILLAVPTEYGPSLVAGVMGVTLIVSGTVSLVNYFTKFRYMIGGKKTFYFGVITLDLGLVLSNAADRSTILVLLYLLGIRALTGVIDLLRALEAKRNRSHWKVKMFTAVFNLAVVVLGLAFLRTPETVVYIYCTGLAISAADRIISAFRKTAIVMAVQP